MYTTELSVPELLANAEFWAEHDDFDMSWTFLDAYYERTFKVEHAWPTTTPTWIEFLALSVAERERLICKWKRLLFAASVTRGNNSRGLNEVRFEVMTYYSVEANKAVVQLTSMHAWIDAEEKVLFDKFAKSPESLNTSQIIASYGYWLERSRIAGEAKKESESRAVYLKESLMSNQVTAFMLGTDAKLGKSSLVRVLAGHQELLSLIITAFLG
jgi:hypothetical protein